ncbi:MAG: peptidoglycan recognition protein family protein [Planctomycetes bacterium]|nr:peptidoglycan recognition protein family protein [Planctomycetota bacterium]
MTEGPQEGGRHQASGRQAAPDRPGEAEVSASSEQTARMEYSDSPAATHRRFVRADQRPARWWVRHRRLLVNLEWAATGLFFCLTVALLYRMLFPTPVDPMAGWRVAADPGRWRYIVLHHSATAEGSAAIFDRYHREERGWENGLGYHFVIGNGRGMRDGEVAVGPRWREQRDGAHVVMPGEGRANAFSIGIVLVGNFEETPPTAAQLASLDALLRFLVMEYGIDANGIVGHGQVASTPTACPGKFFSVDGVVRRLAAFPAGD